MLLTIARYAQWRRAHGLTGGTKEAVKQAIREGRCPVAATSPTQVDPSIADVAWPGAIDGDHGGVRASEPAAVTVARNPTRDRKDAGLAVRVELQNAALARQFLPADKTRRVYESLVVQAMARLDALPRRIAPLLIGVTDLRAIETIIRDEIDAVRHSVADEPPAVMP